MSESRQKVADFLRSHPGWHTASQIADAVQISTTAAANQAECLKAIRFVEKKKGTGRGIKNQYRWKDSDRPAPTFAPKINITIRLPKELVEWIDSQNGDRTSVIERLIKEKTNKENL